MGDINWYVHWVLNQPLLIPYQSTVTVSILFPVLESLCVTFQLSLNHPKQPISAISLWNDGREVGDLGLDSRSDVNRASYERSILTIATLPLRDFSLFVRV